MDRASEYARDFVGKAPLIDKATGNLRAVQFLLGHTTIQNAVRYLGVDIEDAMELAESTKA